MEYNMGYVVGAGVGILFGIIFIAFFMKFTKKDGSMKCRFDERQNIIRGKGYKYAFFTLLIYNALDILSGSILAMYFEREVITFFGIILAVVVYAAYAIWNEGYFSLNENPKRVMILFGVVSVINLASGITSIAEGSIIEAGKVTFRAMNLLCGLMMLFILGVLAVKNISRNRAQERQDEE
ncbi:MAG: hypothetical protein J6A75_01405 [Lachnospiraceae bacterium]|nr:hypothetical protein [Lachnospiraceae bacterium]